MEIIPRPNFRDARGIPARFNRYDPRSDKFDEREVIVNLKDCTRVHPPAVMWCAVYLLLAQQRGSDCLLIPPRDRDVAAHLQGTGLFGVMNEAGVAVEQTSSDSIGSSGIILPLTRFDSSSAEDLTDQLHISLSSLRQSSGNVIPEVVETFSELANNAAEHSKSEIGALGLVQLVSSGDDRQFLISVADGGVGIRYSLEQNPRHRENYGFEWAAIRRATGELVSGTLNSNRGIGLFSAFDESQRPGRQLIIHSGKGIIDLSGDSQAKMVRANLFPGTLVFVSMPT